MKILVRLPNWLGDMVMSVEFIHQLSHVYPQAQISVIAKKGIHDLLQFFPPLQHQFIFDKRENKTPLDLFQFGKKIKYTDEFDLFFCLPNSFSSALMGYATGIKRRVGYKKEFRNILLTNTFSVPQNLHRVDEYVHLLEAFSGKKVKDTSVFLEHNFNKADFIVVNINSEAQSRRLTVTKAVELITAIRKQTTEKIVLIGAAKEKLFVGGVIQLLPDKKHIENCAGKTSLRQLVELLASARLLVTTDSGPAHLANALKTETVVLFGAGNEANTAPYNVNYRSVIRLGELSCEPCTKNICVRYETPQCLERLNTNFIVANTIQALHKTVANG